MITSNFFWATVGAAIASRTRSISVNLVAMCGLLSQCLSIDGDRLYLRRNRADAELRNAVAPPRLAPRSVETVELPRLEHRRCPVGQRQLQLLAGHRYL